ncbi:peptide/nickel transport system permease protein [Clostridiales Family XIII bacterium PM5-7]
MKYIVEKLVQMLVVLLLLSIIVFAIARLSPGDPLRSYYGDGAQQMSEMQREAAREKLGLNGSILTQYGKWVNNLIDGDLGISYKYKEPVTTVIGRVMGNTLRLGGTAYVLTFVLATFIGMFCALRENRLADKLICKIGIVSNCIPSFFIALMLILVFAVNLGIFPTGGAYSYGQSDNGLDRAFHLVLPVTVLVIEHLWYYAYLIRNKLLEETRKDYVLLCKSSGMSSWQIIRWQCLKNVLPSILVMMAIALPHILGGTYVVEMVFSYPGLGTLAFESAKYQDYHLLMAISLLTGIVVVVFHVLAQVISEKIDPRMKEQGVGK